MRDHVPDRKGGVNESARNTSAEELINLGKCGRKNKAEQTNYPLSYLFTTRISTGELLSLTRELHHIGCCLLVFPLFPGGLYCGRWRRVVLYVRRYPRRVVASKSVFRAEGETEKQLQLLQHESRWQLEVLLLRSSTAYYVKPSARATAPVELERNFQLLVRLFPLLLVRRLLSILRTTSEVPASRPSETRAFHLWRNTKGLRTARKKTWSFFSTAALFRHFHL